MTHKIRTIDILLVDIYSDLTNRKFYNVEHIERITFTVLVYSTFSYRGMIFGHVAKLYPYELYDPDKAETKRCGIAQVSNSHLKRGEHK